MQKVTLPGSFEPARLPGFYVDGRFYGLRLGQAIGRAQFLAREHKRTVEVILRDGDGNEAHFRSCSPHTSACIAAQAF